MLKSNVKEITQLIQKTPSAAIALVALAIMGMTIYGAIIFVNKPTLSLLLYVGIVFGVMLFTTWIIQPLRQQWKTLATKRKTSSKNNKNN